MISLSPSVRLLKSDSLQINGMFLLYDHYVVERLAVNGLGMAVQLGNH